MQAPARERPEQHQTGALVSGVYVPSRSVSTVAVASSSPPHRCAEGDGHDLPGGTFVVGRLSATEARDEPAALKLMRDRETGDHGVCAG